MTMRFITMRYRHMQPQTIAARSEGSASKQQDSTKIQRDTNNEDNG
jgi:hypothetical protein